jgi:putative transposase
MRHRLYVHLVWTTRDRLPLITAPLAAFLQRFFPAVAAQERASLLALGIVTTHVHLLIRLHPTTNITRLVQRLKGGSARVSSLEGRASEGSALRWAKGYSLDSVGRQALSVATRYVTSQSVRHPEQVIPGWPADQAIS